MPASSNMPGDVCKSISWKVYTDVSSNTLATINKNIYSKYWSIAGYLALLFVALSAYLVKITTDRSFLFNRFKMHSAALENSQDGVIITDPDNKVVYVNTAFENISGYTADEVLGLTPATWSSKTHDKAFYQEMWSQIAKNGFFRGEVLNRCKNGELYNAHVSIGTVKNASGELTGYVAIQSDITQQKQLDIALRKEKSFIKAILESASEGIATINAEGNIETANIGMETIFRRQEEQIIGHSIDELIHLVDPTNLSFNQLLTEAAILVEGNLLTAVLPNGEEHPIDVTANIFTLDEESHTVLMVRDASERVRTLQALEYKEAMLGNVLNNTSDAVVTFDEDGFIELFSQSAEKMFDYSATEMLIETIEILLIDEDKDVFKEICQQFEDENRVLPQSKEVTAKKSDGSELPVVVTVMPANVGNRHLFTATIQDITQVKSILNSAHDAFVRLDKEGRVIEWNPASEQLFGWDRASILTEPLAPLAIPERYRENWRNAVKLLTHEGNSASFNEVREWVALKQNGQEFPVNITAWPQPSDDGFTLNAFIQDITEKKSAEAKLRQTAYYDSLTKLANRTLFQKTLNQTLTRCRRQDQKIGLLFLDLDKFKLINDTLGHDAGDLLLKTVAERVSSCTRNEDLVARLGGDEFTVLIEGVNKPDDAAVVADKIIDAMQEEIDLKGNKVIVTTSVGIATYPECGEDSESLMKAADIAMYRAKEDGRNKYHFYSDDMHLSVIRRAKLERALRHAIINNELSLNFQPQVDVTTGDVIGFESLLRWENPELGFVSPAEFIPIAEESGLIVSIGEWVLNSSCKQLAHWHKLPVFENVRMDVAVNLSAYQFKHDLLGVIRRAIDTSNLDPSHLKLEITESALMENVEQVCEILQDVNDMGIKISIDDFGTGYSSLQYLKMLPIHTLKIDRCFIKDISDADDSVSIVKSIIALGKSMGLEVIAEGVETREQASIVRELNCDLIQGYYYSRPLTVDKVIPYLETYKLERV